MQKEPNYGLTPRSPVRSQDGSGGKRGRMENAIDNRAYTLYKSITYHIITALVSAMGAKLRPQSNHQLLA
jgi:hypothetical protein